MCAKQHINSELPNTADCANEVRANKAGWDDGCRKGGQPQRVGIYTLRRLIGRGGMGDVHLAEHPLLKRPCALKLIRTERASDPEARMRFESEVQATAQLTHPNTIEIYDYGVTEDGQFYYVMEFLPGMSLQEIVERTGPISSGRVIHFLRQACLALAESHRRGMIHCDVKPANLFASERGGIQDFVKVLDFGLVKSWPECEPAARGPRTGVLAGSPHYAAPELTLATYPVDERADLYSLGATAWFLLTGQPVFPGEELLPVLFAHACQPVEFPSEFSGRVPEALLDIVLKCLEKDPGDRYSSVMELEAALAECAAELPWTQHEAERWWQDAADFTSGDAGACCDGCAATCLMPAPGQRTAREHSLMGV